MSKELELLQRLGIVFYTKRHLQIVEDFLSSGETDVTKLLDQLGKWDEADLRIAKNFLKL